jgi:hypothetical protein
VKWLRGIPGPVVIGAFLAILGYVQSGVFDGKLWVPVVVVVLGAIVKILQILYDQPAAEVRSPGALGRVNDAAWASDLPAWYRLLVGG